MRIVRVSMQPELLVYRDGGRTKMVEEGRCRMCERLRTRFRLTRHHLVRQGWFKHRSFRLVRGAVLVALGRYRIRDCDANIVPLCEKCHHAVEHDPVARAMLRKVLAPVEVAFMIALRGQEWFEHHYPPLVRNRAVVRSSA